MSTTTTKFFTVAELAARWNLSKQKVYELTWDKVLEPVHFGRAVRVPEASVKAYEAALGIADDTDADEPVATSIAA